MITVTEHVYKDDGTIEHSSKKEWRLKSRFLNQLKKIPGISSYTISELHLKNEAAFEIDGVKRKIDIQPRIELGAVRDE